MLTKIQFDIYDQDNFKTYTEIRSIDKNTIEIEIIKCLEYRRIDISLFSNMENAYIKVHSIDDDNENSKDIIIKNNETKTICNYETCDHKLVPGYYSYDLCLGDKILEGIYFMEPSAIEWNDLVNLRDLINTYINGLANNMYSKRRMKKLIEENLLPLNLSEIRLRIKNEENLLINNIKNIVDSPLCDIKKEYKEGNYKASIDNKGQKWLATKGIFRNSNIYVPEIVYSKHAVRNINIPENKWVKKIIKAFITWIVMIEDSYYFKNENLNKQIGEEIKKKRSLDEEYRVLSGHYTVNRIRINQIKEEKGYIDIDIKKIRKKQDTIQNNIADMKRLKSFLLIYSNESWIKDIDKEEKIVRPTVRLFKDQRYYKIYNLYRSIKNMENIEAETYEIRIPYKDTPTIFEYYTVLMIIEILKDINYEWIEGWLADDIDINLRDGSIPKEQPFIFINERENLRIELFYEKQVNSNSNVRKAKISDFVRTNASHYKPDIIMAIFDNTTNKYITSIIIEVKCTKSGYLNISSKPNRIKNQLTDYYTLNYYDMNEEVKKRFKTGAVSKVIVTYPKQKYKAKQDTMGMDINFIQIGSKGDHMEEHYGYDQIKSEIQEVISMSKD